MIMENSLNKSVYIKSVIAIFIMAIITAILQGNPYTSVEAGADRQLQIVLFFALALGSVGLCYREYLAGLLSTEKKIIWTVAFGTLVRMFYVLFMNIWTLQNDGGVFTGFGTPDINNGHIGYIEYIYKFFHLPDMDPYEHFGYYHPPLHHIIEAVWLTIQRVIGVPEALAFENLQVPTLIYSALCMVVMLHILEESGVKEKYLLYGLMLFAFHPRMMVLAGSVNNDILALLLLLTTIWRTLAWIRKKSYLNIILIALSLGFGMLSKLNTAICAFSIALVFLCYLIYCIKDGNLIELRDCLIQYVVFAVIAIPIGLAYIVRNILLFGEKPGIPSPALIPNESVMFTGDYSVWSIIGIPSIWDLHVEFPFHPLSAKAIHNTWVILFQTGLFAEAFPTEINDYLLSFAQIAYVASILLATVTTVVFIVSYFIKLRQNQSMRLKMTFLLFTYIFMLVSFSLYVFKYPYTCSSDFRYMTASLVFTSLGFVVVNEGFDGMFTRWVKYITNFAMAMTLGCSMIVYMFWDLH